jgi:hypothetical protein
MIVRDFVATDNRCSWRRGDAFGAERAKADSGDYIHPNDAGNQMLADAFDLAMFRQ